MRTIISILVAGTLFMASCNKHNNDLTDAPVLDKDKVYLVDLTSPNPVLQEVDLASFPTRDLASTSAKKPSGYMAVGDFALSNQYATLASDLAVVVNNGGVHGNFHMEANTVGTVKGVSRCLVIDGNDAVFGIEITEATNPFLVGMYAHYRGRDNGEGANANPDEVHGVFFVSPTLDCNFFDQSFPFWYNYPVFTIDEGNLLVK